MDDAQKKYRIRVDRDLCIGAASCVVLAPKVFALDEENKAVIMRQDGTSSSEWAEYRELNEEDAESIMEAAKSCPTNAIIIEDEEGNQVYP